MNIKNLKELKRALTTWNTKQFCVLCREQGIDPDGISPAMLRYIWEIEDA